jgi:hypothetical protein
MLTLLLLASLPAASSPAPVQTHDLGRLTFRQGESLSGQAVRVAFDARWSIPIDDEVHVGAHNQHGVPVLVRFPRGHSLRGC